MPVVADGGVIFLIVELIGEEYIVLVELVGGGRWLVGRRVLVSEGAEEALGGAVAEEIGAVGIHGRRLLVRVGERFSDVCK